MREKVGEGPWDRVHHRSARAGGEEARASMAVLGLVGVWIGVLIGAVGHLMVGGLRAGVVVPWAIHVSLLAGDRNNGPVGLAVVGWSVWRSRLMEIIILIRIMSNYDMYFN
jgi:hypothetical protein